MVTLEGRVALVTGGGRGIGRGIALGLAGDGAEVAIGYRRDEEAAAATVAEVEKLGRRAIAYPCSVDSLDDNEQMVKAVLDDFEFVDILVHNAGQASRGLAVADTDPAEVERLWRTHVLGSFALSRLVLPSMRTRPRGDIVMISSAGILYMPPNSAPYSMAKAAQEALAFTLAQEERAHGIHVNVVAPGLVDTEMGRRLVRATLGVEDIRSLDQEAPFGRVCRPEDVADVVRYVVSEQASYLTGAKLTVDGGRGW